MTDCIFCKIANKEIDTEFLYEDDECVIFKDRNPKAATHLLVVPKKHIPTLNDVEKGDSKLISHLLMCSKDIAEKLGLVGYNLQINVGKEGGQEIFHLHIHLMSNS